jgi:hypothetical protein
MPKTSPLFDAYLDLERAMLKLEEPAIDVCDRLRDLMDEVHSRLTDEERERLNNRIG